MVDSIYTILNKKTLVNINRKFNCFWDINIFYMLASWYKHKNILISWMRSSMQSTYVTMCKFGYSRNTRLTKSDCHRNRSVSCKRMHMAIHCAFLKNKLDKNLEQLLCIFFFFFNLWSEYKESFQLITYFSKYVMWIFFCGKY